MPAAAVLLGSLNQFLREGSIQTIIINLCFHVPSELMTKANGTLFASGYGEELVEPDERNVRATIAIERATALGNLIDLR